MTTIDVLPLDLSGDNSDNVPDNSKKEEIIVENVEKLPENATKRRGRPAGSKDGTKRKTPVRRTKKTEAPPPPPPPPEPIIESKKAPKKPKTPKTTNIIENDVKMPVQTPPPPPMTAATFLREMQRQHRAGQEEHWSRIIGPMFVH